MAHFKVFRQCNQHQHQRLPDYLRACQHQFIPGTNRKFHVCLQCEQERGARNAGYCDNLHRLTTPHDDADEWMMIWSSLHFAPAEHTEDDKIRRGLPETEEEYRHAPLGASRNNPRGDDERHGIWRFEIDGHECALKKCAAVTGERPYAEIGTYLKLAQSRRHPNMPRVYAVFVDGNGENLRNMELCIAMEWLDRSLAQMAFEEDPPAVDTVAEQVLGALDHLHKHGIAHGDVSLENIMLAEADGLLRLIDFGHARNYLCPTCHREEKRAVFLVGKEAYTAMEAYYPVRTAHVNMMLLGQNPEVHYDPDRPGENSMHFFLYGDAVREGAQSFTWLLRHAPLNQMYDGGFRLKPVDIFQCAVCLAFMQYCTFLRQGDEFVLWRVPRICPMDTNADHFAQHVFWYNGPDPQVNAPLYVERLEDYLRVQLAGEALLNPMGDHARGIVNQMLRIHPDRRPQARDCLELFLAGP